MQKKKQKAKTLLKKEETIEYGNYNIIPNVSVGPFYFDQNIDQYTSMLDYFLVTEERLVDLTDYEFFTPKIIVSVNENLIESVSCPFVAILNGINLIGMSIQYFMKAFDIMYDTKEKEYVNSEREHHYRQETIYTFDSLGLMLYTYRNNIRLVCCFNWLENE